MRLLALLLLTSLTSLTVGCGDTIIHNDPTGPSGETVNNTNTQKHKIEFRVSGNATSARIRFSNPVDGLTQVVTSLPYVVSTVTTQPSMFLSLEATPISYAFNAVYPYMAVQIFVDNALFREATIAESYSNPVSVSGTWRFTPIQSTN